MLRKIRLGSLMAVLLIVALLAACSSAPTPSSTPAPTGADPAKPMDLKELALNPTADREKLLLEAALKKGPIMMYTGTPAGIQDEIIKRFKAKYGLEVVDWRATGMEAVPRVITEFKANKMIMDVLWASDPPLIALSKEQILTPYKSKYHDGYAADLFVSDRVYPTSVNFWMWAYNTTMLKPEELPHTFEDLLDPKWKGKITIARYTDWFQTLWTAWGDDKARAYFTKLAAQEPLIQSGFTGTTSAIVSGERPLTISMVSGNLVPQMQKGASVDGYFNDDIIVSRNSSIGWYHDGGNPEGGLLFIEFILSPEKGEGQEVMKEKGRIPAHKAVDPDPPSLRPAKYTTVNFDAYMPEQAKWDRLFDETFRAK